MVRGRKDMQGAWHLDVDATMHLAREAGLEPRLCALLYGILVGGIWFGRALKHFAGSDAPTASQSHCSPTEASHSARLASPAEAMCTTLLTSLAAVASELATIRYRHYLNNCASVVYNIQTIASELATHTKKLLLF